MIAALAAILSTAVGRWTAIGLVGIALYGAGVVRGRLSGASACDAAALRTELSAARRALAISQSAALDAERRAAALAMEDSANADQIRAYQAELAKRPDAARALTGDDVRRLRNIR